MGQLANWLTFTARVAVVSRTCALVLALAFVGMATTSVSNPALAQEQTVVTEVVVRGNQRIEAETVRSYTMIKPGMGYSPELADQSLKQLFATGLFADITMRLEGTALVVSVV
ncbi:MAG TPA: outer membrane protein assembly factor BamA, partial [Rhodobiaceae bacterium]|nr:outer membrane protein assembly factor BamA [Rhodobiaceae bacterium]